MTTTEDRRREWPIPTSLGAKTDDLYVFPWPTRDEALVLFNVEDLGAVGPAAGSLALLRERARPEVLWKGEPFVAYLDEYWLGVGRTVWFTADALYAFARPYLRGRFAEEFLFVIRAKDHRCAVLSTPFPVLRAQSLGGGVLRLQAVPDPAVRVLRPDHLAAAQAIAPMEVVESSLEWFDGNHLRVHQERLQDMRTDLS